MRIVDAEPQLLKDLVDETEVITTKEMPSLTVYAGRHPTLGRLVIIENRHGDSVIVEITE